MMDTRIVNIFILILILCASVSVDAASSSFVSSSSLEAHASHRFSQADQEQAVEQEHDLNGESNSAEPSFFTSNNIWKWGLGVGALGLACLVYDFLCYPEEVRNDAKSGASLSADNDSKGEGQAFEQLGCMERAIKNNDFTQARAICREMVRCCNTTGLNQKFYDKMSACERAYAASCTNGVLPAKDSSALVSAKQDLIWSIGNIKKIIGDNERKKQQVAHERAVQNGASLLDQATEKDKQIEAYLQQSFPQLLQPYKSMRAQGKSEEECMQALQALASSGAIASQQEESSWLRTIIGGAMAAGAIYMAISNWYEWAPWSQLREHNKEKQKERLRDLVDEMAQEQVATASSMG